MVTSEAKIFSNAPLMLDLDTPQDRQIHQLHAPSRSAHKRTTTNWGEPVPDAGGIISPRGLLQR